MSVLHRARLAAGTVLALVTTGGMAVALAGPASAHVANIVISCSNVQFNYTNFVAGETASATETVTVNGTQEVSKVFTFTGPTASDTVAITVPGGSGTVVANTSWTVDGGGQASLTQQVSGCSVPCPTGIQPHFRWHYSANGSSGSWSATTAQGCPGSFSMGPQSMEGALKVSPGTTLMAGYDFTLPGNHATLTLTVSNAQLVFAVRCVSHATPSASTFTVTMPAQSYTVTNDQWYPSGDQHSPLVYQGSIAVPDLCAGGQLDLSQGATFSASLS